jgi:hypothetical protein
MKILFLGDFSGYHAAIARQLRLMGHDTTVVSNGNRFMDTYRDIDICRTPGYKGGMMYMYKFLSILQKLKGYDIVQLCNPHFLELRPGKIAYFLHRIKDYNDKLCLSLCSTDHYYAKLMQQGKLLDYSEYNAGATPTDFMINCQDEIKGWLRRINKSLSDEVYNSVSGAVSALYEYHIVAQKVMNVPVSYGGIGIDTDSYEFNPISRKGKLKVLVGIKRETAYVKGIYRIQEALENLQRRYPSELEVKTIYNVPLKEYLQLLSEADVVADQLYSYTPATNALQSMALGKVVISGGEEAYYNFIDEPTLRPIINLSPLHPNYEDQLMEAFSDRKAMSQRSIEGRMLVEKHNDIKIVTNRFLKHWEEILRN